MRIAFKMHFRGITSVATVPWLWQLSEWSTALMTMYTCIIMGIRPLVLWDLNKMACRYFQMYFREWKFCVLIQICRKIGSMCQIENRSSVVQVMACYQKGTKPLPEPVMTPIYDASRHQWVDELWVCCSHENKVFTVITIQTKILAEICNWQPWIF